MKQSNKAVIKAAATVFIINFFVLIAQYVTNYLLQNNLLTAISEHLVTLAETILPLCAAAAMLSVYAAEEKFKKPLLHALIYALTWFITLYFEYFIAFCYSGYEVVYSLLISVLWALLMTVAMYAEITVLFFIMIFAMRIFASKRYGDGHGIGEYMPFKSAFDFRDPVAVGIFSAATALFLYNLGMEIANTVNYIASCAGIYTAGEIFYLVFRYLFILATLLLSHFVSFTVKNKTLLLAD